MKKSHLELVLGVDLMHRYFFLVTSSQNFVGRMKGPYPGSELSYLEGVFSLSKRLD
jgi:hypothetical protein